MLTFLCFYNFIAISNEDELSGNKLVQPKMWANSDACTTCFS